MWRFGIGLTLTASVALAQAFPGPTRLGAPLVTTPFGAANQQLSPALAALPGERLVVVWLDWARHPEFAELRGAIVDLPTLVSTPLVLPRPTLRSLPPALACGPLACLVVWLGFDDDTGTTLFGQRLTTTGTPIGPPLTLSAAQPASRGDPDVAVGTANEFIVVWQDVGVSHLSVLDANGTVRLSPRPIAPGARPQRRPAVTASTNRIYVADDLETLSGYEAQVTSLAFDGGELVPWTTVSTTAGSGYLSRLSASGDEVLLSMVRLLGTSFGTIEVVPIVQGAFGPVTVIDTGAVSFGAPAAARTTSGWVVVAADEERGVRGLRVGTFEPDSGVVIGQGRVGGEPPTNYSFRSVLGLTTATSGALWIATTAGSTTVEPDIVIANLDPMASTVTPDGGLRLVKTSSPQNRAAVAVGSRTLLTAWAEQAAPDLAQVVVRPLDRRGTFLAPPNAVSVATPGLHRAFDLRVAPTPDGFVLAWTAASNRANIHLLQLDETGSPRGPETVIFDLVYNEPSAVAFASSPTDVRAFFGSYMGTGGLWSSGTDSDGGWTTPARLVMTNSVPGAVGAATVGQHFVVAWNDGLDVVSTRLNFDGGSLGDHLQGPLFTGIPSRVALAADGTDALVVWTHILTAGPAISGTLVSGTTGRPMGSTRLYLGSPTTKGSRDEAMPLSLAFDGNEYVLVTSLGGATGSGAMWIRIDRQGQGLAQGVLADGPEHEFDSVVASDGRGRVAFAWTQSDQEPSTKVWASLQLSVPLGETCLATSECRTGTCTMGRCCAPGSPCPGPDGGNPDAGDSGAGEPDAGELDAGEFDAGVDAGLTTDGGTGQPPAGRYVVGCVSGPGAVSALIMLMLLRRSGRR